MKVSCIAQSLMVKYEVDFEKVMHLFLDARGLTVKLGIPLLVSRLRHRHPELGQDELILYVVTRCASGKPKDVQQECLAFEELSQDAKCYLANPRNCYVPGEVAEWMVYGK